MDREQEKIDAQDEAELKQLDEIKEQSEAMFAKMREDSKKLHERLDEVSKEMESEHEKHLKKIDEVEAEVLPAGEEEEEDDEEYDGLTEEELTQRREELAQTMQAKVEQLQQMQLKLQFLQESVQAAEANKVNAMNLLLEDVSDEEADEKPAADDEAEEDDDEEITPEKLQALVEQHQKLQRLKMLLKSLGGDFEDEEEEENGAEEETGTEEEKTQQATTTTTTSQSDKTEDKADEEGEGEISPEAIQSVMKQHEELLRLRALLADLKAAAAAEDAEMAALEDDEECQETSPKITEITEETTQKDEDVEDMSKAEALKELGTLENETTRLHDENAALKEKLRELQRVATWQFVERAVVQLRGESATHFLDWDEYTCLLGSKKLRKVLVVVDNLYSEDSTPVTIDCAKLCEEIGITDGNKGTLVGIYLLGVHELACVSIVGNSWFVNHNPSKSVDTSVICDLLEIMIKYGAGEGGGQKGTPGALSYKFIGCNYQPYLPLLEKAQKYGVTDLTMYTYDKVVNPEFRGYELKQISGDILEKTPVDDSDEDEAGEDEEQQPSNTEEKPKEQGTAGLAQDFVSALT